MLVLMLAAVLCVAFSLGRATSSASIGLSPQRPHPTTVVRPGETLWEIVGRVEPDTDPRIEVARLVALNHLRVPELVPGQQLVLP